MVIATDVMPKVVAAIPCYNEERFIGDVVHRASNYVDEVIVIDDGSRDGTSKVAREAGACVVNHPSNGGYGESIKSCFHVARECKADVLVILDGDGQHNPDELPRVLSPILSGEADMVIGSRFMCRTNHVPRYRKLGIDTITWLFNIGSPVKVSDSQSGFRAYGHKILDTVTIIESGMGVSVELLVEARKRNCVILEVPISCEYHAECSTINPVSHGINVALAVVKLRFRNRLNVTPSTVHSETMAVREHSRLNK